MEKWNTAYLFDMKHPVLICHLLSPWQLCDQWRWLIFSPHLFWACNSKGFGKSEFLHWNNTKVLPDTNTSAVPLHKHRVTVFLQVLGIKVGTYILWGWINLPPLRDFSKSISRKWTFFVGSVRNQWEGMLCATIGFYVFVATIWWSTFYVSGIKLSGLTKNRCLKNR